MARSDHFEKNHLKESLSNMPESMPISNMRFSSPLLVRYLAKKFFLSIILSVFVMTSFVALVDGLEMMRRFASVENMNALSIILLILYKLPSLILQVFPFCILLASLVCFSGLAKSHELIAIRSSGIPARQFLLGPLLLCFALGLLDVFAISPTAALLNDKYERIENTVFPGSAEGLLTEGGSIWLKQSERERYEMLIYADKLADRGRNLHKVSVFRFAPDGRFIRRMDAESMSLVSGRWEMQNVIMLEPDKPSERLNRFVLPTSLTLETIQNSFSSPASLSIYSLPGFIKSLKAVGFPSEEHQLHFFQLLAKPAFIMAMFLLGIPFALHFSRQRGVGTMVLIGLVFGFCFYFFSNFVGAYSLSGRLNLLVAAWAPAGIAILLALALFLHYREE